MRQEDVFPRSSATWLVNTPWVGFGGNQVMNERCSIFALAASLVVIVSCTPGPAPAESKPDQPTTASLTASITPRPTLAASATEAPLIPTAPLSSDGPWLLVLTQPSASQWSFWAMNADGSGLTQLVDHALAIYGAELRTSVSPHSGLVTFVDETENNIPQLRLISLRDHEVITLATLMPPDFDWALLDEQHYQAAMQTYAAVTRSAGVWSKDGRSLAFVGAMDGPSSDIYLYSAATGEITRLTDGPTEAVSPVWSPDERYVLHGSATDLNYGASGAGYALTGVWAARPDGSGAHLAYPLDYRGFDRALGWISESLALVDSWEAFLDFWDLRTVDIESGETESVWAAGYTGRAFDPGTRTVLFYVPFPDGDIRCDVAGEPGVYLLGLGDGTPRRVAGLEPNCTHHGVTWSDEGELFFVETAAGVVPVTPEGALVDIGLTLRFVPSISPTGGLWAMSGDGVWIGTPQDGFRRLSDWDADLLWRPDGEALYLKRRQSEPGTGFELYLAQSPEFSPSLLPLDLGVEGWTAIWVQP